MYRIIRQALRDRRARRRKARDEALDALLQDEATRAVYWQALADECAESSLMRFSTSGRRPRGIVPSMQ